jgi:hypothetical protein
VSPGARILALSAAVALGACLAPEDFSLINLDAIHRDWASKAAEEERWDDAYAAMKQVVAKDERNPFPVCPARDYLYLGIYAGMSCRLDEAEQEMERAHECYVHGKGGLEYLASFELAELQFGRKNYAAAAAQFKQALAEMGDRVPMSETLALRLDDYAVALDESGDRAGAVAVRERVYGWRIEHAGSRASSTPLAYGRGCAAP